MDNSKNQKRKNNQITAIEEDFAQWYTDICSKCELMSYTSQKGFIVYRPYSYAMWEKIQEFLNIEFKRTGHSNVYLPTLIPEHLMNKEKDHVEGFSPECAVVTVGGGKQLEEKLYVRPTSETLFCDFYSKILNSYKELPIKYNQWCSVIRWEKTTKPFLRGSEFLWQEGHTLHRTEIEAREEALTMLKVYEKLGKEALCIPFVTGRKTEKEKFAGAEETYSIEALMKDGQALQSGTTHYFGNKFAANYNIKFLDSDNTFKSPYQTSFGVSTRLLGAVIMVHGDDNGLVLPPYIAPIQVAIIPIKGNQDPRINKTCKEIATKLEQAGVRTKFDDSDVTPGFKFNEYEMKGVPIRIDLGPKDLDNSNLTVTRRFDNQKKQLKIDDSLVDNILAELEEIKVGMYNNALKFMEEHTTEVHTEEEFKEALTKTKGYVKMMWDGTRETEDLIKEKYQATSRCMPFNQIPFDTKDPISGKEAKFVCLFARSY